MTTSRAALAAAVLLAVAIAGCGDDPDGTATSTSEASATTMPTTTEPSTPTTTTTSTPPETTMPTDDGGGEEGLYTEADDGATIEGTVGDQALLRLSSDWAWDQPEVSGTSVVLTPVDYLVDPGFVEWIIEMTGPGDSEIVADGSPNCADAASCPDRTATFQVHVDG